MARTTSSVGAAKVPTAPSAVSRSPAAASARATRTSAAASRVMAARGTPATTSGLTAVRATVRAAAHQAPSTGSAMPARTRWRTRREVGTVGMVRVAGSSSRNAVPSAPQAAANRSSVARWAAVGRRDRIAGTATIASPSPAATASGPHLIARAVGHSRA